jgi:hypothetical protein
VSPGRARLGLLVASLAALPAAAAGQVKREIGVQATVTTAAPVMAVAGPAMAWRVGRRDRIAVSAGLGASGEGELAGRGEILWHFMLNPAATRKPALYAAGGLGASVADRTHGWVVLAAGVDWSPGGRGGWMAELGIGGGLRVVAGYRWRK